MLCRGLLWPMPLLPSLHGTPMSDLIEQLRDQTGTRRVLRHRAADEIERLSSEGALYRSVLSKYMKGVGDAEGVFFINMRDYTADEWGIVKEINDPLRKEPLREYSASTQQNKDDE